MINNKKLWLLYINIWIRMIKPKYPKKTFIAKTILITDQKNHYYLV